MIPIKYIQVPPTLKFVKLIMKFIGKQEGMVTTHTHTNPMNPKHIRKRA